MSLPVGVGLLALGIGRAKDTGRWKWILAGGGAAGIMVVALIMSWSRGAWLGFAAALAAMAVAVVVRSGRAAVVGAVLAILIAYLLLVGGLARLPAPIVQRFNDFAPYLGVLDVEGKEIDDANFAVLERVAHWQAAWSMWTEHPWFGVGVGNYEVEYSRYALPLWPHPLGHAHNYYLNLAAEAGVTGLSAFLLLWGAVLMTAWRATRTTSGWHWCVALGVLGVVVHATVHSFFDNLFVHGMYLHLAIVLGLLEASGATEEGQNP
jgi:O-antigen ligase